MISLRAVRQHISFTIIFVDRRLTNVIAGLFAPRQGQVYREQQRRRQSQFDRGTPGAEAELSAAMGGLRISPTDRAPPGYYRYSNN